jgi:hypothetical protein
MEKPGLAPGFFVEKARNSAVFATSKDDFGLVVGTLVPKVRSLPDESIGSGFLMEGKY